MVAHVNTVTFHGIDIQIAEGCRTSLFEAINPEETFPMIRILSLALLVSILASISSAYALTIVANEREYALHVVYEKKELEKITGLFNAALKKFKKSGEVDWCSDIINLPWRSNSSYGGFCTYTEDGKKEKVMICTATMTTRLKIESYTDVDADVHRLATFIASNCYGG